GHRRRITGRQRAGAARILGARDARPRYDTELNLTGGTAVQHAELDRLEAPSVHAVVEEQPALVEVAGPRRRRDRVLEVGDEGDARWRASAAQRPRPAARRPAGPHRHAATHRGPTHARPTD